MKEGPPLDPDRISPFAKLANNIVRKFAMRRVIKLEKFAAWQDKNGNIEGAMQSYFEAKELKDWIKNE